MNSNLALFLYIAFIIFAIFADNLQPSNRRGVLAIVCIALTFMVGLRNIHLWGDTAIYVMSFQDNNDLFHLKASDSPLGYAEKGFFYLSTLIKVFTDSPEAYLTVISAISFYFLYKSFDKYSIYPLFGVAIYLARFYCGRNMMQIRSCLAIAIIILILPLLKYYNIMACSLQKPVHYCLADSAIVKRL